ncbi:MAG TPA: phosphatidate cytidylyltransferase [Steroidobacteraceae bacterium]|nr:phosphatidate cytidylyltransferase [Steroidobacteraceae bacterium]
MLKVRVATAAVLAALVLVVLFALPAGAGIACIAIALLAGSWEWARFAGLTRPAGRLLYVLASAALAAVAWERTQFGPSLQLLLTAAAGWWCVAFLWLALKPHAINHAAAAVAGFCVLVPAWVGIGRLLLVAEPVRGAAWLFYMLLLVWAADIGAYFTGHHFGRIKLAPEISPGKTWEGLIGGVLAGLAVAASGAVYFRYPPLPFVALGLVVVLASVVGDLTESMFKRFAGLKDSGSVLPGHGGLLDRIDSITSSVPFFVLGLGWLGALK